VGVAEIAIIATDLAEVLGSALAFKLLLSVPLWIGVLTGLDTMLVLAFQNRAMRKISDHAWAHPDDRSLLRGPVGDCAAQPKRDFAWLGAENGRADPAPCALSGGRHSGATVMPHNLYLHSAIARKRPAAPGDQNIRLALRFATIDIVVSLLIATVINGAILALAASAFHAHGYREVADIADAWRLLAPLTGHDCRDALRHSAAGCRPKCDNHRHDGRSSRA
jgi:manganese transport protein